MKTRYLMAAMTLPLMFSCTQDDFTVQEGGENGSALQNRIKVGQVTFAEEGRGSSTRMDYASGQWEAGDMFRLYLMDGFNSNECGWGCQANGENADANTTHFMEQQVWNSMYELSNRPNSSAPFIYGDGKWTNDDVVMEGNYFAVAPATGAAEAPEGTKTQKDYLNGVGNRRDVWVYINPVQKFYNVEESKNSFTDATENPVKYMTDGMDENQFFLGYTQVYRNEEATDENNKLELPIQMRPILANVDLRIQSLATLPFRLEKIVISHKDGLPMPTLAYVRPCGNTPEDFGMRQDDGMKYYKNQWGIIKAIDNEKGNTVVDRFEARYPNGLCGDEEEKLENAALQEEGTYKEGYPAFAQPYIVDKASDGCNGYIDNYYWTIDSWTRAAARSVVEYSYPGEKGFTPYGCTDEIATPAYEYVIDFTNEKGLGVELANREGINPFITLPHNMDMSDYYITVYGQQWNDFDQAWEEGIIVPGTAVINDKALTNGFAEDDGRFTLPTLDLTTNEDYIKATIQFSDFKVVKTREIQTTNSADLLKNLQAYYGTQEGGYIKHTSNEFFYVTTLGDFVVTNDLVNYVQDLYDHYAVSLDSKPLIYFKESKDGSLIFPENLTNDHAIDLFYYNKLTKIVNRGTQVIEKPIIYHYENSVKDLLKALDTSLPKWCAGLKTDGIDLSYKLEAVAANMLYGGIASITNEKELTIKNVVIDADHVKDAIYNAEGATLNMEYSVIVGNRGCAEAEVLNEGTLNMTASAIFGTLHNDGETEILPATYQTATCPTVIVTVENFNDCIGCKDEAALLVVDNGATLMVGDGMNGYVKGSDELYLGIVENYGEFIALNEFVNYGRIVNGSEKLAGLNTTVTMSGVVNKSGLQCEAVKLNNGAYDKGIINWGDLTVDNEGYIYVASEYASITLTNNYMYEDFHSAGVIENTKHANIRKEGTMDSPMDYNVIIYTVDAETANIEDITEWISTYNDYNKVVLKVDLLTAEDYTSFDKLSFQTKESEVEFANNETLIQGRAMSEDDEFIVHLATSNVKVDGTVRLMDGTKLRVGQYENPNISCTVYGKGLIDVQNHTWLEAMGAKDVLNCTVEAWGNTAVTGFESTGDEGEIRLK